MANRQPQMVREFPIKLAVATYILSTLVVGSTFRVDASLLNQQTNIIRITITGSRGTVVTLPNFTIMRPGLQLIHMSKGCLFCFLCVVFCSYFVDRERNEIVIRCLSGDTEIQALFEYTIEGRVGVFTGVYNHSSL